MPRCKNRMKKWTSAESHWVLLLPYSIIQESTKCPNSWHGFTNSGVRVRFFIYYIQLEELFENHPKCRLCEKKNTCKQCLKENSKMWFSLLAFKFCVNYDLVEWIVSQIFITETVKPEVSRLWGTFKISVGMAKLTNYVFMSLQSTCFVNIQCFVVLRKEASWGGQTNNQNNKSDYLQVCRAAASHNNHENNPNISPPPSLPCDRATVITFS